METDLRGRYRQGVLLFILVYIDVTQIRADFKIIVLIFRGAFLRRIDFFLIIAAMSI